MIKGIILFGLTTCYLFLYATNVFSSDKWRESGGRESRSSRQLLPKLGKQRPLEGHPWCRETDQGLLLQVSLSNKTTPFYIFLTFPYVENSCEISISHGFHDLQLCAVYLA